MSKTRAISIKNLPKAGEHHQTATSEYWSLAPLPIPLDVPPVAQAIELNKATDTTLDYGKGDYWGTEFAFRIHLSAWFLIFLVTLSLHGLAILRQLKYAGESLSDAIYNGTATAWFLYPVNMGFAITFSTLIFSWLIFTSKPSIPIRFNREKREVACQLDDNRVVLVNWEEVNAQVSQSLLVNPHYVTNQALLTLYLPQKDQQHVMELTMPYGAELLAMGEWEAIRLFMEQGLDTLKQHTHSPAELSDQQSAPAEQGTLAYYNQQLAQHPFGSVPYFYALKGKKRLEKDGYYLWCFWQLCSGWTIPCYLAKWLNKLPVRGRHPMLLDWSKPIPKSQWKQPSQELTRQSQAITQAYAQGISFKHYFTNPPSLKA